MEFTILIFLSSVVLDGAQGAAFHAGRIHVHEAAGRQTG
jgi:hypothetical protein